MEVTSDPPEGKADIERQPGVRLLSTEALDSADADVRRLAAIALGRRGIGASHRLGAALANPSAGVRREAARSLACLGDEASDEFSRLAGLLKDGDRQVRLWSARAIRLIRAEDVSTARALIEVLQTEPDEEFRGEAAWAFAQLASRYSSCALPEGLVAPLKNVKEAGESQSSFEYSFKDLVRGLHRDSVDEATRHFLRTVSTDPDAIVRLCAIRALARPARRWLGSDPKDHHRSARGSRCRGTRAREGDSRRR